MAVIDTYRQAIPKMLLVSSFKIHSSLKSVSCFHYITYVTKFKEIFGNKKKTASGLHREPPFEIKEGLIEN